MLKWAVGAGTKWEMQIQATRRHHLNPTGGLLKNSSGKERWYTLVILTWEAKEGLSCVEWAFISSETIRTKSNKQKPNQNHYWQNWRNTKPCILLVGVWTSVAITENILKIYHSIETITTIWYSCWNPTSGNIFKRNERSTSKTHLLFHDYCNFIRNR